MVTNPHAKQTCLVVLGSSAYPNCEELSNPQFKRSAEAVRDYFAAGHGFGLVAQNILFLLDDRRSWLEQINRIKQFVQGFSDGLSDAEDPVNVLIYCIGHGHNPIVGQKFYLCLRDYSHGDDLNGLMDVAQLSSAISSALPRKGDCRAIYFIDTCFSGQAAISLGGGPSPRGIALLCSVDKNNPGLAQEGKDFTLFTELLLEALERSSPLVSFWSLKELHWEMKERVGQRGVAGLPMPELHDPVQPQGKEKVSEVKLFPVVGMPRATGKILNLLVIERRSSAPKTSLSKVVKQVSKGYHAKIIEAANAFRQMMGVEPVESNCPIEVNVRYIEDALHDKAALQNVVAELCRADVAAFDLTDWDAGVIFLLGVRSVVRRGITICSIGSVEGVLSDAVPFNLQLLNISAHSAPKADEVSSHFADKIVTGFKELAALPNYLDLPSYDLVRKIGGPELQGDIIPYSEGALVLCSFEDSYTRDNWNNYLRGDFLSEWHGDVNSATPPQLQRLLDIVTPRLIAHKLFEVIRFTDFCLVDWTGMRPNVIFEAGVRMAVHPLGAVHILDKVDTVHDGPGSQSALIKLFDPIRYDKNSSDGDLASREMIKCFKRSDEAAFDRATGVTSSSSGEAYNFNFIYEYAGKCLDVENNPPAMPLVDEMVRDANFLHMDDAESVGSSSLLYFDVNQKMKERARIAASERRLAAWLYLSKRWAANEIVSDAHRWHQFEWLAAHAEKWAAENKRSDIREDIEKLKAEIEKAAQHAGATANGEFS